MHQRIRKTNQALECIDEHPDCQNVSQPNHREMRVNPPKTPYAWDGVIILRFAQMFSFLDQPQAQ